MLNTLLKLSLPALMLIAAAGGSQATPAKFKFHSNGRSITMARWAAETPGPHKAVLLLHGGGGPQLIENDANYTRYPLALAKAGFDVYMPYYWEATAPSDDGTPANVAAWLQTAENALAYINAQPTTRAGQVSAIGLSYGAYLGLMLAAQDPGLKALVSFYGWLPEAKAATVRRMPPTLILHGDKDALVDVKEAYSLQKLFTERHISFEMKVYPGENHGFLGEPLADSEKRMVEFLTRAR